MEIIEDIQVGGFFSMSQKPTYEGLEQRIQELQEKEYIRYEHLPLETNDGRPITVEFISNVYLVNRKKVIQCNIRDITKRKRAEEALRKSDKKLSIAKRMEAVGFMAAGTALPMI
jgi:C4-dicarboxylate-specific signal transduction histidine kinase